MIVILTYESVQTLNERLGQWLAEHQTQTTQLEE